MRTVRVSRFGQSVYYSIRERKKMATFAIMGFVFGIFGLLAFFQVHRLQKQVYLLRLDVRNAGAGTAVAEEKSSCGCGCGCS